MIRKVIILTIFILMTFAFFACSADTQEESYNAYDESRNLPEAELHHSPEFPDGYIIIREQNFCTSLTALDISTQRWGFRLNDEDIVSLSYMTNLRELNLSGNAITDISPLAELTNLRVLNLNGNLLNDITPLAGLTNLEELRLVMYWQIYDVTPLKTLVNLETLHIGANHTTVNWSSILHMEDDYNLEDDVGFLGNERPDWYIAYLFLIIQASAWEQGAGVELMSLSGSETPVMIVEFNSENENTFSVIYHTNEKGLIFNESWARMHPMGEWAPTPRFVRNMQTQEVGLYFIGGMVGRDLLTLRSLYRMDIAYDEIVITPIFTYMPAHEYEEVWNPDERDFPLWGLESGNMIWAFPEFLDFLDGTGDFVGEDWFMAHAEGNIDYSLFDGKINFYRHDGNLSMRISGAEYYRQINAFLSNIDILEAHRMEAEFLWAPMEIDRFTDFLDGYFQ